MVSASTCALHPWGDVLTQSWQVMTHFPLFIHCAVSMRAQTSAHDAPPPPPLLLLLLLQAETSSKMAAKKARDPRTLLILNPPEPFRGSYGAHDSCVLG